MNVYITKVNGMGNITQAMQFMTAEIAHGLGFREMGVYYYNANAEKPEHRSARMDGIIAGMQAGDIVICQFHTWNGLRFERALVDRIKAYRGRAVIFIHSLEALMISGSRFMLGETVELYNQAEALIVPSYAMKKFLLDSGIREGMKFVVQEMWDYPVDMDLLETPAFRKVIYCHGVDQKVIRDWDYEIPLNQDESIIELSKGGFGLEWYHNEQSYEYMRYGNSFSLSRSLSAGIPVIVPAGISCQKLIEENHLGFVVDSLDEAVRKIENMAESEYQDFVQYVRQFAPALREGYYTKKSLIDSVQALFREDMGKAFVQAADIYELGDCKFTSASLKKSYGGNLALSWDMEGKRDGFLIYDSFGSLIEETGNSYQHYFRVKEYGEETGFIVKAYVNTQKGKLVVSSSEPIYPGMELYEKPLVSIVIPAYNAETYVARCIDTVLAQSFSDLEIIVVDDGSTDHTPDIVDWYAQTYSNITVVHQENAGLPAARNAGIIRANGEYTAFVDSDDMIRPAMAGQLYHSAKRNRCDIAITSVYEISRKGYRPIIQYGLKKDEPLDIEEFFRLYISTGYAMPSVCNKLYRSALTKKYMFPQVSYEDEAWTPYILSYADQVCYLDSCGYEYDRSDCSGSLIDHWAAKSKDEVFRNHKKSILFYLEHGNPKRREWLRELSKSELLYFTRTLSYEEYRKLWEWIAVSEM